MVANANANANSVAAASEPVTTPSPTPRLLLPLDTFFGLSVATLSPASDAVEKAIASGAAQDEYARLLAVCCAEFLTEAQRDKLRRRFLDNVRLDLFARYWSPETASLASVVAQFVFLTALFAADDVRDSQGADEKTTQLITRAWRDIPALVDGVWGRVQSQPVSAAVNAEELFEATVERLDRYNNREMDAHARLLAMASAQVRVAAGSDAAYTWYARECAKWGAHSFSIRERDMADVSLAELLNHRYREGATTLTILHMLVSSGLPLSPKLVAALSAGEDGDADFARPDKSLFVSAGLHICLVNDILSYDRDELEAGFQQNFVEYQRRHHVRGCGFDSALVETVRHSNALVESMGRATRELQGEDNQEEVDSVLRVVLETVARSLLGNVRWSVECKRYSRTDLVLSMVAAP